MAREELGTIMSRQAVILMLLSAIALSAVVPGLAGFATARFESLERSRRELVRLQAEVDGEVIMTPTARVTHVVVWLPRKVGSPRPHDPRRLIFDFFPGHGKPPKRALG
jgi:hypothetical protein